ncbi:hypothetical protein CsSME_00004558 [Camellia sinensis var. sinensis]|uniref:Small ribosomal subunit protein mS38 n=1 Tax=Camellia sinensis TaxID=4442 RepID=A0A7J7I9R4_CAMSI|nr:hypothetical protein HYC85_002804 [Camellia sinensis]
MASLVQKLLTKQSVKYIIPTFNKLHPPNLIPPLFTLPHLTEPKPLHPHNHNVNLDSDSDSAVSSLSTPIFPSFPFGFSLNPISSTGFVPFMASDTPMMIWADSVKKKRKRKMNKHKYRKLRKRLSRQT